MRTIIPKDFLDRIDLGKLFRYAIYFLVALIFQNILFTQLRIAGICPLVLPAVAIAMGMFEGATWGPLFSLALGIFADMGFVENRVFFTLLFPALSFSAAFVANYYINRRFVAYMVTAGLGLLLTGTAQALKTAASDTFSSLMVTAVLQQTLWSLPFAAAAYLPPARLSRGN